jgi:hypothetical protein
VLSISRASRARARRCPHVSARHACVGGLRDATLAFMIPLPSRLEALGWQQHTVALVEPLRGGIAIPSVFVALVPASRTIPAIWKSTALPPARTAAIARPLRHDALPVLVAVGVALGLVKKLEIRDRRRGARALWHGYRSLAHTSRRSRRTGHGKQESADHATRDARRHAWSIAEQQRRRRLRRMSNRDQLASLADDSVRQKEPADCRPWRRAVVVPTCHELELGMARRSR